MEDIGRIEGLFGIPAVEVVGGGAYNEFVKFTGGVALFVEDEFTGFGRNGACLYPFVVATFEIFVGKCHEYFGITVGITAGVPSEHYVVIIFA